MLLSQSVSIGIETCTHADVTPEFHRAASFQDIYHELLFFTRTRDTGKYMDRYLQMNPVFTGSPSMFLLFHFFCASPS